MRMRIWGSRGSIAAPGASTKRYGGNTSCVEILPASGEVVILDAGTGIRELGVRLVEDGVRRIHLLLTHLHVDHLEGLGMFAPIYARSEEHTSELQSRLHLVCRLLLEKKYLKDIFLSHIWLPLLVKTAIYALLHV